MNLKIDDTVENISEEINESANLASMKGSHFEGSYRDSN
jgi:hypothetical protein